MDTAIQNKESYYRKMLDLLVTREFTAKSRDRLPGGYPGKTFEEEQSLKMRTMERDFLLVERKQALHKIETALERPRLDPLKPGHELPSPRHEPAPRKNENAIPKLETGIHNLDDVLKRNSESLRKSDCLIEKSSESSKWMAVTKTTTVTDVIVSVKTNCAQCHGGSSMPQATTVAKQPSVPMMQPRPATPLPQLVQSSRPNAVALPRALALPPIPGVAPPLMAIKEPGAYPTFVVKTGPQLPSLMAVVQPAPQTLWTTAVQPGVLPVFAFKLQNVPLTQESETTPIGRQASLAVLTGKPRAPTDVLPTLIVDASPQGYYQAMGRVSLLEESEGNGAAAPRVQHDLTPLSDEDLQLPPARHLAAAIVEMPALPRNQEVLNGAGDMLVLASDSDLNGNAVDLNPPVRRIGQTRAMPHTEVVLEQLGTPATWGPALMPE